MAHALGSGTYLPKVQPRGRGPCRVSGIVAAGLVSCFT
jgi:hypothetical protein